MQHTHTEPRATGSTYRLAPQYQRCCLYGVCGCVLLAATAVTLRHAGLGRGEVAPILLAHAAVGLALLYPLSWRWQLEQDGIYFRSLLRNVVWRREAFRLGHIRRHPGALFRDQDAPWHAMSLDLRYLAANDRRALLSWIHAHLPEPTLTSPAKVQFAQLGRGRWECSRLGLKLHRGGVTFAHPWRAVRLAYFRAQDVHCRDFTRLLLVIDHHRVELCSRVQHGQACGNWRGDSSESIRQLMETYCPPEQFEVAYGSELPEHAAARAEDLRRALHESRVMQWVASLSLILLCGGWIYLGLTGDWLRAGILIGLQSLLIGPLLVAAYVSAQRQVDRYGSPDERRAALGYSIDL